MSNTDDGTRGRFGVLVSINEVAPSRARLTLERVRRVGTQWETMTFITNIDLPKETMLEMSMSDDELHSLGLVLAAELSAMLGRKQR